MSRRSVSCLADTGAGSFRFGRPSELIPASSGMWNSGGQRTSDAQPAENRAAKLPLLNVSQVVQPTALLSRVRSVSTAFAYDRDSGFCWTGRSPSGSGGAPSIFSSLYLLGLARRSASKS